MAPSWISTSKALPVDLKPEEMAGKQDVAGRRHRNELGQPFQKTEQQCVDNCLVFHLTSYGATQRPLACHGGRLPV